MLDPPFGATVSMFSRFRPDTPSMESPRPFLEQKSSSQEPRIPWSRDNLPNLLFVNNEYVAAKSKKTLELHNPRDNSFVADNVALAGQEDVNVAVDAAAEAFKTWRNSSGKTRRDCLLKLANLIEANGETLAELTRLTLGAPYTTVGFLEINMAVEGLRFFAGYVDKFAGETFPQEDGFLKTVRNEPLGIVAAVVPWNGPLGIIGLKAGPALATGNTLILKPSEKTPFAALALGTLIKAAGFPPGVFQVLSGDGSTGALLASHMKISKISFTGSTATGRKIQEMSAKSNLKQVALELGGKSPAVVFDDCDFHNAVAWCVDAITINSGQTCFAASRVYVQEGIYERFLHAYKAALEERGKGAGDPDDLRTTFGPIVDKAQYDRVMGFIERGRSQETLLTGGERIGHKGFFVQPTVFEGVGEDAEISRSEIFGPVSIINKFKTEQEVLGKANNSEFGLMAGVFTQDIDRAFRVASEFETGSVGINCIGFLFFCVPFGGTKLSGLGRENGVEAMRAYTERKTVVINMSK